jgi:hypothetical protein
MLFLNPRSGIRDGQKSGSGIRDKHPGSGTLIFSFLSYVTFPGHWSAWLVDEEGVKRSWGIIPSKYKVEEELLLKRPLGECQQLTIEFFRNISQINHKKINSSLVS